VIVIDCRPPVMPTIPVVAASRDGVKVSSSNRHATARHYVPGRRVELDDLDYLTPADRDFIYAVTGELLWPGQRITDRPISAFAMQIAVDRRTGRLPEGALISVGYLQRTADYLTMLGVPANPFSGALLERARSVLGSRPATRIDLVC
jgi:hypothetical protein